jgi:hypothetical protein
MTTDDARRELHALLVRAAETEAARQKAIRAGDILAVQALENELRRLWRRHAEIERGREDDGP